MDFFNQISFGPNIFLTKTTSMSTTTTTIKMGFDTIEINLVWFDIGVQYRDKHKGSMLGSILGFDIRFQ